MTRTPKRYVLLSGPANLGEAELEALSASLASSGWKAKVIAVAGTPRSVIIRTDGVTASRIRDGSVGLRAGGTLLRPVLTSGAIGKLKRRAAEVSADG